MARGFPGDLEITRDTNALEMHEIKDVLITGTDGFIGGIVKDYLIQEGFRVYGTTYIRTPGENEVRFDVRKEEDFRQLPDRPFEVVVHTIGLIDQTLPKKLVLEVNAEGTRRVCSWATHHGCQHFIQLSSTAVYGLRLLGENRTEETHRNRGIFGIPYMKSKAQAERYIEASGLKYTMLRMPSVLGPNDTFITPAIVPHLLDGTFFTCGKKDPLYSMFYVRNLGPVIAAVIRTGPTNAAYNCTDYTVRWSEYVGEYGRQLGMDIPTRTKSLLSIAQQWKDKHTLLLLSHSRFGASYRNDRLVQLIGVENITKFKWQDGVTEAINAYFNTHPDDKDPRKAR